MKTKNVYPVEAHPEGGLGFELRLAVFALARKNRSKIVRFSEQRCTVALHRIAFRFDTQPTFCHLFLPPRKVSALWCIHVARYARFPVKIFSKCYLVLFF